MDIVIVAFEFLKVSIEATANDKEWKKNSTDGKKGEITRDTRWR